MAIFLQACRCRSITGRLTLALWVLALVLGCGQPPGPPREAKVDRVIDGDTAVLEGGARVRFLGIDAPEMASDGRPAEPLAHQSKDYVAELIQGKTVRLEYDRERYDRYGRLLAYLYLPDGAMVNLMVVRQGLARVYSQAPNLLHQETLNAAQQEAMAAGRGLWQNPWPSSKMRPITWGTRIPCACTAPTALWPPR